MSDLTLTKPKSRLVGQLWEVHGAFVVTAICLLFIVLAWITGKYGSYALEITFYVFAYVIGGYQKAWEGLETLIKEKRPRR
jgi:Zn2+/Cd2+-exporting ATPase